MKRRRIACGVGMALLIAGVSAGGPPPGAEPGKPLTATKVRVEPAGRTIAEVAKALGDRIGMPVVMAPDSPLAPGRHEKAGARPAPAGVAGEMMFWEALDRLGREARLEIAPRHAVPRPAIELESLPRPPAPSQVRGAYRVSLVGLVEDRTIVYGDPTAQVQEWALRRPVRMEGAGLPPSIGRSHALLRVLVEPRPLLDVRLSGPPRVDEAVDDRGRSLVAPRPEFDFPDRYTHGRLPIPAGIEAKIFLDLHDPPGRQIRRFRGVVPLVVWSEHPEPLDVPLAGAEGRTFRGSGVVLKVVPTRLGRFAVDMRPEGDARAEGPGGPLFDAGPDRMFLDLERQFEVVDAAGRRLDFTPTTSGGDAPGSRRVTLTPKKGAEAAVPARLRYRGLSWTRAEVPFDFERLPLP